VGKGLGDRKTPSGGVEIRWEDRDRDLVSGTGAVTQRGGSRVEPLAVVRDQLAGTPCRVFDRFTVARQGQLGRQLDRALEGAEVGAERVGAAVGVTPDGRRDVGQQMVSCDEYAVALEPDVTIRMAGEVEHAPAIQRVSLVKQLGTVGRPDERAREVALPEHVAGDRSGRAVAFEPGSDPLRPVEASPHALALCVVQLALVHCDTHQRHDVCAGADVVRVEVGDDESDERLVEGGGNSTPPRARLGEAEAGVDRSPTVLAPKQVNVHVAGRKWQRERCASKTGLDLHTPIQASERMFYTMKVDVEYREEPCKSALNRVSGMPFSWSLNPYMGCAHRCTFCYVRAFERRADRPADDRYGRSIRVKVNIAEVLRRELRRPSWHPEAVAIGAATDPYQPAEGRYRLTRSCLEALADVSNPFSLITRNPMIVRDVDVLREAASRAEVGVVFSVPTLDEEVWRKTEPATPPPQQRLEALSVLVDAGIKAGVGMAPILPGISDRPEQLEAVVRAAREAGATSLWANLLYLRPGTREHFLQHLARDWPEELERYERLYADRAYLPRKAAEPVRAQVAELRLRYGIADRRRERLKPAPEPEQLALAV
jgi:DNA repair photolyase